MIIIIIENKTLMSILRVIITYQKSTDSRVRVYIMLYRLTYSYII